MSAFLGFPELLSLISGTVSLTASLLTILYDRIKEELKIRQINEGDFTKAIDSNDLKILGDFLQERIGNVTVYEYIHNSNIRIMIDKYFERLHIFLGQDIENVESKVSSKVRSVKKKSPRSKLPKKAVFTQIYDDYTEKKEAWNLLAGLRRNLEIKLREIAILNDVNVEHYYSAGRLNQVLFNRKVISGKTYKDLQTCIRICNNEIHGLSVSEEDVGMALKIGQKILSELKRFMPMNENGA